MTNLDIAHQRLSRQRIAHTAFEKPAEVVQWLGAVQSQDYGAAKWAVGQRTAASTDADLDQAFAEGSILRTHVLRPTWHFVVPADIRWMLALTAPRVRVALTFMDRKLELDDAIFGRSNDVLVKALQGGKHMTRPQLVSAFQQTGIAVDDGQRSAHIIMHAELDAIICSGALRGKQHTYALLDERAPQSSAFTREEALVELARRYITSRGPATLKDFVWWSGLTMTDAKAGFEMVRSECIQEEVDGQLYWSSSTPPCARDLSPTVYLLPNFDEYVVGYTDRSAIFDASHTPHLDSRANPLFNNAIILDGQIAGTWQRTIKKSAVDITLSLFQPLNEAAMEALITATNRYGAFLERAANITVRTE
ncbi:MAG TPA: winged helix DNA-binding domain-containing protein [Ktedonosporobacter sp.]|nr:winged helix DNA-binding domain-containing protein [Ktedonosporobacter sp.]